MPGPIEALSTDAEGRERDVSALDTTETAGFAALCAGPESLSLRDA